MERQNNPQLTEAQAALTQAALDAKAAARAVLVKQSNLPKTWGLAAGALEKWQAEQDAVYNELCEAWDAEEKALREWALSLVETPGRYSWGEHKVYSGHMVEGQWVTGDYGKVSLYTAPTRQDWREYSVMEWWDSEAALGK